MLAAIKGLFFSSSSPPANVEEEEIKEVPTIIDNVPVSKPKRPRDIAVPVKLGDRAIPGDLLQRGLDRISAVQSNNIVYSLNEDKTILTVNVPKGKKKRKDYTVPHYATREELLSDIRETMAQDGFTWMDSLRMASEYPLFFWDCMFHYLGQVELVDSIFQPAAEKNGNQRRTRRRLKK